MNSMADLWQNLDPGNEQVGPEEAGQETLAWGWAQGLFLEGAGWDAAAGCLCEPPALQLVMELPIVHFCPAPARRRPHRGTYACPLYATPARTGTADNSGFVANVPLRDGGASADHWVLRGTALLLALAE